MPDQQPTFWDRVSGAIDPIPALKRGGLAVRDKVAAALEPEEASVFDTPLTQLRKATQDLYRRHIHALGTAATEFLPSPLDVATGGFGKGATLAAGMVAGVKRPLNVLVGMESSGAVRDAFRRLGHNAYSSDLLPSNSPYHLQGDVRRFMDKAPSCDPWDIMIGHPPCTHLASSGLHWNKRVPGRDQKTEEALRLVEELMSADIPHIAIENPVGRIGTAIRPADQYIQPYEFGSDASKRTGLWLKDLPKLQSDPSLVVAPREVIDPRTGRVAKRWANQTDSGQNRLPPSPDRWSLRSRTYPGIAEAMAQQWSDYVLRK